jgi:hypothetical protein
LWWDKTGRGTRLGKGTLKQGPSHGKALDARNSWRCRGGAKQPSYKFEFFLNS